MSDSSELSEDCSSYYVVIPNVNDNLCFKTFIFSNNFSELFSFVCYIYLTVSVG